MTENTAKEIDEYWIVDRHFDPEPGSNVPRAVVLMRFVRPQLSFQVFDVINPCQNHPPAYMLPYFSNCILHISAYTPPLPTSSSCLPMSHSLPSSIT